MTFIAWCEPTCARLAALVARSQIENVGFAAMRHAWCLFRSGSDAHVRAPCTEVRSVPHPAIASTRGPQDGVGSKTPSTRLRC
jgi:hypothetical protein